MYIPQLILKNFKALNFKVIRAGLNRYFEFNRSIDIVTDEHFTGGNVVFDGVQVQDKHTGKGTLTSTPHVTDDDMKKIAQYFSVDHVRKPQPKAFLQTFLFYNMYFFCWCGQDILHEMTKDHFEIIVDPTGVYYVIQKIDEKD